MCETVSPSLSKITAKISTDINLFKLLRKPFTALTRLNILAGDIQFCSSSGLTRHEYHYDRLRHIGVSKKTIIDLDLGRKMDI